jgi:serine/threonine protein kinase
MSYDKGTAGFSAPEILKSQPYSSKCDIWSAGCLIHFLSTGKHPFLEPTISQIIKTIE